MRKIILVALLLSSLTKMYGQATFFRTNIFTHHSFNKTLPNFTNGHFILGNTNDSLACNSTGILLETDSAWKIIWASTFTEGGIGNVANDFTLAGSHSLLVTGTTFLTGCSVGQWYVNRFDSSGKVLWSKTFGRANVSGNGVRIISIDTLSYMLMGNRNDTLDSCFVMKMDLSGNILWLRSFPNSLGNDMVRVSGDQFVVAGTTSTSIPNAFAFDIDTSGKTIWAYRFTNGENAGIVSAAAILNHQILLGGFYGASSESYAPLLLSLDMNGNILDANNVHATSADTLTLTTLGSDQNSRWLIGFDDNHVHANLIIADTALNELHESLLATKGGIAFIQPKPGGGYWLGGSINGANTTPFLAQTDTAGFIGCDDSLVVDTIKHLSFSNAAFDSLHVTSLTATNIVITSVSNYDLESICEHDCWIQPVIQRMNDSLLCTPAGLTYQWLDENLQPISGATNQLFIPPAFGKYYVSVSDAAGCSGRSWVFNYDMPTGIASVKRISFSTFPNPFTSSFNIQLNNNQKSLVNLYSLEGKLISKTEATGLLHLDASSLPRGAYLIQVVQQDGQTGSSIIVKQ